MMNRKIVSNLAIIPARSGSKGLKDKNIRSLDGKPLMTWTIEAAFRSELFDQIMVSTDSERYASIAKKFGASVPFLRSKKNASDTASSWDMVREVLEMYQVQKQCEFDNIVLLQPTSPLRTSGNIREAYELFWEKEADAVVSVCEVDHPPLWSNTLPEDLSLAHFIRSDGKRRQDMEKYYRINGAIYIVKTQIILEAKDIYGEKSFAYIMDREQSIDIDTEFDFKFAELIKKESVKHG